MSDHEYDYEDSMSENDFLEEDHIDEQHLFNEQIENNTIEDNNENDNLSQLLTNYQENVNDAWLIAPKTIDFNFNCFPLIYYQYEDIKGLENGNKIILPNKILNDLSVFREIEYPAFYY